MRDVQNRKKLNLADLLYNTLDLINDDPYTLEEIEDELCDETDLRLENLIFGLNQGDKVLKHLRNLVENGKEYKIAIQNRLLHVYSEAMRVLKFADLCRNIHRLSGDDEFDNVKKLGKLMTESHASLKDRFDCSCEALDELHAICLEGGALGAKLTGAGFGGCIVSLVETNNAREFEKYVKRNYYANMPQVPLNAMFRTTPSGPLTIVLV